MRNIVLFIITISALFSCQNDKTKINAPEIINKTTSINKSKFLYKNLTIDLINANDTIQPKNIKELFGVWNIDSIADVGGSMQDEELIQSQIGHELLISNSQLSFHFLNENLKIDNPNYSLTKDNDNKGTTLGYGYKDSRKFVTSLIVNKSYYF